MSNIRIDEKIKQDVNKDINQDDDNKTHVVPPELYDLMLMNDNTVQFHAVQKVLEAVLQIGTMRAMRITMHAHLFGKASVFTGPRDVADQYKEALLAEALTHMGEQNAEYLGYARMRFEVEKAPK